MPTLTNKTVYKKPARQSSKKKSKDYHERFIVQPGKRLIALITSKANGK